MGHSRPRPKHIAKKLLQIRRSLRMSQGEMVKQLGSHFVIRLVQNKRYQITSILVIFNEENSRLTEGHYANNPVLTYPSGSILST